MTTIRHHGVTVLRGVVNTGFVVNAGDTIQTRSTGIINFGGGVGGWFEPCLDADGDPVRAPDDYPVPALRKNSLICEIGGQFFQGGVNRTFVSPVDGELLLFPNDRYPGDNTSGWQVTIIQTTPTRAPDTTPNLSVSSIECVQVIQNEAQTVQLVSEKRAMLRIFLDSGLDPTADIGMGPGALTGVVCTVTLRAPFAGPTTFTTNPGRALASGTHRRNVDVDSIQVAIPVPFAHGDLHVEVSAQVTGLPSIPGASLSATATRTFSFRLQRREQILPLLLDNPHEGRPAPTFSEYMSVLAAAAQRLAIADNGLDINPAVTFHAGSRDYSDQATWTWLLIQLATLDIAIFSSQFAGIRSAVLDAPLGAWGGLGTSVPWGTFISRVDGDQSFAVETFIHEWMHAYGQLHANFCGAGWPYDDRLTSETEDAGFDVLTSRVTPSSDKELMSYCSGARWPSVATYQTGLDALRFP